MHTERSYTLNQNTKSRAIDSEAKADESRERDVWSGEMAYPKRALAVDVMGRGDAILGQAVLVHDPVGLDSLGSTALVENQSLLDADLNGRLHVLGPVNWFVSPRGFPVSGARRSIRPSSVRVLAIARAEKVPFPLSEYRLVCKRTKRSEFSTRATFEARPGFELNSQSLSRLTNLGLTNFIEPLKLEARGDDRIKSQRPRDSVQHMHMNMNMSTTASEVGSAKKVYESAASILSGSLSSLGNRWD